MVKDCEPNFVSEVAGSHSKGGEEQLDGKERRMVGMRLGLMIPLVCLILFGGYFTWGLPASVLGQGLGKVQNADLHCWQLSGQCLY